MPNALETVEATESQVASKVTTLQTAVDQVANAVNARAVVNVAAENVVLVANDIFRNGYLEIIGASVSGRTVTWPLEARIMFISTSAANAFNVSLVRGTTTFVLVPGAHYMVESDGTANDLTVRQLALEAPTSIPIGADVIGNETLEIADANTFRKITATSTITVPPNASVPFNIGTVIYFQQTTSGQGTFALGAGVTIESAETLKTRKINSVVSLYKKATNIWVLSGDLEPTAFLGQLAFPAIQNPSANANTLDDYEEGTWVPVLTFNGAAPTGLVYSTQSGSYTKIGNRYFVEILVQLSNKGTGGSGDVFVSLPFAVASQFPPANIYAADVFLSTNYLQFTGLFYPGTSTIGIRQIGSGIPGAAVTWALLTNASNIGIAGNYR